MAGLAEVSEVELLAELEQLVFVTVLGWIQALCQDWEEDHPQRKPSLK